MPFCELWGCFVIDKTRKVKFLYNIIRFPLWRKTTIQLKYTETHKKGCVTDLWHTLTAVLGIGVSLDSVVGTYCGVLQTDVETILTLNINGTYLLIQTYKEEQNEQEKLRGNISSAWRKYLDVHTSFEWWQYILQGEGWQQYYFDWLVW